MSAPFGPESIPPGTEVGAYVIGRKLGMGGGGVVYEAASPKGNRFALKMSRYRPGVPGSRDSVMEERFQRACFCHEHLREQTNVVKMYGFDRFPDPLSGWLYLVMELVPGGETITRWARRRAPSLVEIIRAFKQLAEVCGVMHQAGIRHRDIKPGNILMAPGGVPKLLDFNSATCRNARRVTGLAASALPCTPGYLPPELCLAVLEEGWTELKEPFIYKPTADLYALGVVFYEVLTGQHPFNLDLDGEALLSEIATADPTPVRELNSDVPAELEEAVMMLLRKNPRKRYQTGHTLATELDMLLLSEKRVRVRFRVPPGEWELRFETVKTPTMEEAEEAEAPEGPEPIAALVRVERWPAPVRVAGPATPRRPRRPAGARALVAVLLAVAISWMIWTVASMAARKGLDVLQPHATLKAGQMVAIAATCAAVLGGCAGVRVRQHDMAWLKEECSPEARETVRKMGLKQGLDHKVWLLPGENVREVPDKYDGYEVRSGPVEARGMIGFDQLTTLRGNLRLGEDGVSIQFTSILIGNGDQGSRMLFPVGTVLPICAVVFDEHQLAAGYPTHEGHPEAPPASERHPGFVYMRAPPYIDIRFAWPRP